MHVKADLWAVRCLAVRLKMADYRDAKRFVGHDGVNSLNI